MSQLVIAPFGGTVLTMKEFIYPVCNIASKNGMIVIKSSDKLLIIDQHKITKETPS